MAAGMESLEILPLPAFSYFHEEVHRRLLVALPSFFFVEISFW